MGRSYADVVITEGTLLPDDLRLGTIDKGTGEIVPAATDGRVVAMCDKYYDHDLFKRLEKHCKEAGQTSMRYGYADCALPVVLEHNTPNNSVPLLWAETDGKEGPPMRSLFHRRDRHG